MRELLCLGSEAAIAVSFIVVLSPQYFGNEFDEYSQLKDGDDSRSTELESSTLSG